MKQELHLAYQDEDGKIVKACEGWRKRNLFYALYLVNRWGSDFVQDYQRKPQGLRLCVRCQRLRGDG